tara:strand:+ start:153 stop:500 length:348 start_codon:yes stop_codon:yes gene_type:complete
MKKIFLSLFFTLLLKNAYSSDNKLYTWGFAGGDCKTMGEVVRDYGKEGESAMRSAIRGFLTGYNLSQPINKYRTINSSSSIFILSYLKEFCRKQGDEGRIYEALIAYYETLPSIN